MNADIILNASKSEVSYNLETGKCCIYLADENKLSKGIREIENIIAAFKKEGAAI